VELVPSDVTSCEDNRELQHCAKKENFKKEACLKDWRKKTGRERGKCGPPWIRTCS
jgi:hypothetical protein